MSVGRAGSSDDSSFSSEGIRVVTHPPNISQSGLKQCFARFRAHALCSYKRTDEKVTLKPIFYNFYEEAPDIHTMTHYANKYTW